MSLTISLAYQLSRIVILFRTVLMNSVNQAEGCSSKHSNDEIDHEHKAKRAKTDEDEMLALQNSARGFLTDLKNRVPKDFRPTGIRDDDIKFLKEIFQDETAGVIKTLFKCYLYRLN